MSNLILIIVVFLSVNSAQASRAITTLYASEDSKIFAYNLNPPLYTGTNYGSEEFSYLGVNGGGYKYCLLIKFDLTGITQVGQATLRIQQADWYYGSTSYTITVHRIYEDWEEMTVTWENQPSYNATYEDSQGASSSTFYWYEFDIIDLASFWVDNPSQNYGVFFNHNIVGGRHANITMRESGMAPELVINDTVSEGDLWIVTPLIFLTILIGVSRIGKKKPKCT